MMVEFYPSLSPQEVTSLPQGERLVPQLESSVSILSAAIYHQSLPLRERCRLGRQRGVFLQSPSIIVSNHESVPTWA
jgi:hypothetical protein